MLRTRFALICIVLILGYALLGFHVYQLQVVKGDYYLAKADGQIEASEGLDASRGSIYFTDKNGNTLPAAVEVNVPIIYAVPKDIADPVSAAKAAAPILNMPESQLQAIFSKPDDQYELLSRNADSSEAQEITDLNIKGLYSDFASSRSYPLGSIASQVLGYVGPDSTDGGESGHYGIESYYNSELAAGKDVVLTIDPNIQIESEKILDDLVKSSGATGGNVIVEDPMTGKILAMAGDPSFDPNNYSASPIANFVNPNVQGVYEPGSIFKVLTMAAGLDTGKLTPTTTYDDTGTVHIDGANITNYNLLTHGPYGPGTTMTQVIEHSINTGAIFAENLMGNQIFAEYMKKFKLDDKTGIDLPGEVDGNLNELRPDARQVDFDTAAYGQGVAVTPIELVTAISAIANGGTLMRPYLNSALSPEVIGRVVSTSTARQAAQMMVDAVDLANVANIDGYAIAGKTGSAFMPDFVHGGYTNKLIDSYIAFGPASNPRFVALIRLNSLPETSLAAETVVPASRDLAQYIINYYNIPPDRVGRTSGPGNGN